MFVPLLRVNIALSSDLLRTILIFMYHKTKVMAKWRWKKCKFFMLVFFEVCSTFQGERESCLLLNVFLLDCFRVTNPGIANGVTRLQPSSNGKRIFETA